MSGLSDSDLKDIERATLLGLSPRILEEDDGWLLAMDDGTIGRMNSVCPLEVGADPLEAKVARAERRYGEASLAPVFRVPEREVFAPLRARLAANGYTPRQPTFVRAAAVDAPLSRLPGPSAETHDTLPEDWTLLFAEAGADPQEGMRRGGGLTRAGDAIYAEVREQGRPIAAGVATFALGWAGVNGMRTLSARRGEGLAGRVLRTLAESARTRGVSRMFLQVERNNAPALRLYDRAGFEAAGEYAYWRAD